MNEKFAPDLLEHRTEIVDCILLQIKEMVSGLPAINPFLSTFLNPPSPISLSLTGRKPESCREGKLCSQDTQNGGQ